MHPETLPGRQTLQLKGISTGDFSEALTAILGEGASGLSATDIVRLKSSWEADYKAWSQRDWVPPFFRIIDADQHRRHYLVGSQRPETRVETMSWYCRFLLLMTLARQLN